MLITDTYAATAYRNAVDHLQGPLRSGAIDAAVAIAADATVKVDWVTREPLLVAVLRGDLTNGSLSVSVTPAGGVAGRILPAAYFADWTPAGAALPLFVPQVDAVARTAQPFSLQLAVQSAQGAVTAALAAVPAATVASLVELHVLEGLAGRVAFLMLAEQTRLRRTVRVLAASGFVASATGDALDRIGAELGVPRFSDRLTYDAATNAILTQALPSGEPDGAYARRLAACRPFVLPDRAGVAARLAAGGVPGVTFQEVGDPFPVALRVVSIGADAARANFFTHVSNTYLVSLDTTAAADAVMHARFTSPQQQADLDAQRGRIAAGFTAPAGAAVAPFLADALDLAFAVRQALLKSATPAKIAIARAFDPTAGSRYELGFGADVKLPAAAEQNQLATAVAANPAQSDARVGGAIASMAAALKAAAPDAAMSWFWRACGLRTVEALDAATVFVSTTAVGPLTIEGMASAASGTLALTAVRRTPDDPDVDAVLARAVAATAAAWTAAGHAAWTTLSAADAKTAWSAAVARPASDPVGAVVVGGGFPAIANPSFTAAQLALIPTAMLITVKLAAADAAPILAHATTAAETLRSVGAAARAGGVSSALVLTSATDVILVFGGYGLPGAGLNVGERGASAIRWSVVPLSGEPMLPSATGGAITLSGSPSLALAVAVSGARGGAYDPYEAAVILPPKTVLDLDGYELAMNVLGQTCPIGTIVNTWDLREAHVGVNGDGIATPLPAQFATTYRAYRRRRYRGEGPPAPGTG